MKLIMSIHAPLFHPSVCGQPYSPKNMISRQLVQFWATYIFFFLLLLFQISRTIMRTFQMLLNFFSPPKPEPLSTPDLSLLLRCSTAWHSPTKHSSLLRLQSLSSILLTNVKQSRCLLPSLMSSRMSGICPCETAKSRGVCCRLFLISISALPCNTQQQQWRSE